MIMKKNELIDSKYTPPEKNSAEFHPDDKSKNNMFGAIILIILGAIFLLNNFGILPWSIWRDLWRIWPLFLIFWGFQLIFSNSKTARVILWTIIILICSYFFLSIAASTNPSIKNYLPSQFPYLQLPSHNLINDLPSEDEHDDDELEEYFNEEFKLP
jgi:hypothetical protein